MLTLHMIINMRKPTPQHGVPKTIAHFVVSPTSSLSSPIIQRQVKQQEQIKNKMASTTIRSQALQIRVLRRCRGAQSQICPAARLRYLGDEDPAVAAVTRVAAVAVTVDAVARVAATAAVVARTADRSLYSPCRSSKENIQIRGRHHYRYCRLQNACKYLCTERRYSTR